MRDPVRGVALLSKLASMRGYVAWTRVDEASLNRYDG